MKTIFIIIFFFILSFVFISLSQKQIVTKEGIKFKFNRHFFVLSFLCLFFLLFNRIGVDYNSYIYIISNTRQISLKSIEPLFSALCIVFNHLFSNNYAATYFMLTAIALFFFYTSFYLIRKDVNLCYCLLAFELFSFCRFYLVSMHLASSLMLLSFILLYKNKNIWGLIVWAMASLIHTSGFFIAPLLFVYIIMKWKKKVDIKTLVIIMIPILLMSLFSKSIYLYAIQNINSMRQYGAYGLITNYSGTGIVEYLIYIPLFYYFFRIYQRKVCTIENRNIILFFLLILGGFVFAVLGYQFQVLGRTYEYFMAIYILIIPFYLQNFKNYIVMNNSSSSAMVNNYAIEKVFFIIYIVVRGFVIIYGILRPDSSSQVIDWEFFWPF